MSSSCSSSSVPPPPPQLQYCSVCGHESSLRCSTCLGTLYCSVTCQRKDLKTHKVTCKQAEKVKKRLQENGYRTAEEIDAKFEEDIMLAELGVASAQYNMGLFYFNGVGVNVDKSEGVKWFRLAAAQGNADAQYILGAS